MGISFKKGFKTLKVSLNRKKRQFFKDYDIAKLEEGLSAAIQEWLKGEKK